MVVKSDEQATFLLALKLGTISPKKRVYTNLIIWETEAHF